MYIPTCCYALLIYIYVWLIPSVRCYAFKILESGLKKLFSNECKIRLGLVFVWAILLVIDCGQLLYWYRSHFHTRRLIHTISWLSALQNKICIGKKIVCNWKYNFRNIQKSSRRPYLSPKVDTSRLCSLANVLIVQILCIMHHRASWNLKKASIQA